MSCRDEILSCVTELIARKNRNDFNVAEVIDCMQNRGTRYKNSTIRTHISSRLCANAPDNHNKTYPDFEHIYAGKYRLLSTKSKFSDELKDCPQEYRTSIEAEVILIDSMSKNQVPELTNSKDRTQVTLRIHSRCLAFRLIVRDLYEKKCAVCGLELYSPTGSPEVEGAHIYPKALNGSDDPRNGICLCRLHHWAFDAGWFTLSNDLKVLVRNNLPDQAGYDLIEKLKGKFIALPLQHPELKPHPIFLTAHRTLHGFN